MKSLAQCFPEGIIRRHYACTRMLHREGYIICGPTCNSKPTKELRRAKFHSNHKLNVEPLVPDLILTLSTQPYLHHEFR